MTFWGPKGLYLGLEKGLITVLGSTHVVQQLLFSIVPLILTFDFDLIFGSLLTSVTKYHLKLISIDRN